MKFTRFDLKMNLMALFSTTILVVVLMATVGKDLVDFADNLAAISSDLDALMTGSRKV